MKLNKRGIFFATVLFVSSMVVFSFKPNVYADAEDIDFSFVGIGAGVSGNVDWTKIDNVLGPAINVFLALAISISMIAIIRSGIKYAMAQGDAKATNEAKQSLTYSIFALILTLGSFTFMKIILNLVGGENADIYLVDQL